MTGRSQAAVEAPAGQLHETLQLLGPGHRARPVDADERDQGAVRAREHAVADGGLRQHEALERLAPERPARRQGVFENAGHGTHSPILLRGSQSLGRLTVWTAPPRPKVSTRPLITAGAAIRATPMRMAMRPDRKAGGKIEVRAGLLQRLRPALLHPAERQYEPGAPSDALAVEPARPGVVEDRHVALHVARIGLHAGVVVVVEGPEAGRGHHAPAVDARLPGPVEVNARPRGAVGRMVDAPDQAPVARLRRVGAFENPDPVRQQA